MGLPAWTGGIANTTPRGFRRISPVRPHAVAGPFQPAPPSASAQPPVKHTAREGRIPVPDAAVAPCAASPNTRRRPSAAVCAPPFCPKPRGRPGAGVVHIVCVAAGPVLRASPRSLACRLVLAGPQAYGPLCLARCHSALAAAGGGARRPPHHATSHCPQLARPRWRKGPARLAAAHSGMAPSAGSSQLAVAWIGPSHAESPF